MTPSKSTIVALLMALSVMPLVDNCSVTPTQLSGGASGTEVSAVVTGSVVDSSGRPVGGAVARLRPADFLTDSSASTTYVASHSVIDTLTSANGQFTFSKVRPDSYDLEISLDDSLGVIHCFRLVQGTALIRLMSDTLFPMGTVEGNVQVDNSVNSIARLQVYGMQCSVPVDSTGQFSIKLPPGRHMMHLGAYLPDSLHNKREFDGMDIAFGVQNGEYRDIGSFTLRFQPPTPCQDISCDSMAILDILYKAGLDSIRFDSVCTVRSGRVVGVNFRGLNMPLLSMGIALLDSLDSLDIGKTGIMALPPDIGRLKNLATLLCDGNNLTTVPQSLGDLTALKNLDLSGNSLDSLPDTLTSLISLTNLNLSNNKLCQTDSVVQAWADRYAPGWKSSQQCP